MKLLSSLFQYVSSKKKTKKKNMLVVGRVAAGLYHRRHFLHMEVQLGPNWRTIYSNPSRKAEEKTQRASSIFTFCSRTLQPPRRGRDLTWGRNKPNKTPKRWNLTSPDAHGPKCTFPHHTLIVKEKGVKRWIYIFFEHHKITLLSLITIRSDKVFENLEEQHDWFFLFLFNLP